MTRKQQKKYCKKIFRHLLEQSLWNTFALYKKYCNRKVKHADFILLICEKIFQKYLTSDLMPRKSGRPSYERSICDSTPLRLIGRHFPQFIPASEKKQNPTRMCVICCHKTNEKGKKIRKESRYYCRECDVGLCIIPCFEHYHTKEDLF